MPKPFPYVFLGSPQFAVVILGKLRATFGDPSLVITQPPRVAGRGQRLTATDVEQFARKHSINFLSDEKINTESTLEAVQRKAPKIILVAAFGQILKEPLLKAAPFCLNVHASLLPKYRGAAPIQRSILSGDSETGVTIQRMAKKLDTGDILLQKKLPITDTDTSNTLFQNLALLGAEASVEAFETILAGKEVFTPQDESLATYAPKIEKTEAAIVWSEPGEVIERKIRAFQPWPIAQTVLGGAPLKIWKTEWRSSSKALPPSGIETDGKTFLCVGTGSPGKSLSLLEVQAPNRSRVAVSDFLRGFQGNFPFQTMG